MDKLWIYHYSQDAKIIERDELEAHIKKGWAESPSETKKPVKKTPVKKLKSKD